MDDVLVLLGQTYVQNELLEQVPGTPIWSERYGEERTEIFGEAESVSRTEWYEGGREGMKPEIVFVTPSVNYNGQQEAEFCGRRYRIYRTYRRKAAEETELYLEEQAGVAHGKNPY